MTDGTFQIFGLTAGPLVYSLTVVFLAGIVRGYSGFGFSALCVASLTLVLPPAQVVPVILMLEVAASIGMLPQVWRDVDWRALLWLTLGAFAGAPFGVLFLAQVPADAARIAISILVLAASLILLLGYQFKGRRGPRSTFATGFVSGVVNGIGSVGGLPVVMFLLASAAGAAMTRAVVVAYFLATDIYTTGLTLTQGLLTWDLMGRLGLSLLPLFLGIAIGSRHFLKAQPESFRRFTLSLLIFLALLGLVRTLLF